MKNFREQGDMVVVTAPNGGVTSGFPVLQGSHFGVAVADAAEGADVVIKTTGVFEDMPRATGGGSAWTKGDTLYWDTIAGKFTKSGTAPNKRVAVAAEDAADADAVGVIKLLPVPGIIIADLGAVVVADNTKASIDTALATIVAKINAALAGLR